MAVPTLVRQLAETKLSEYCRTKIPPHLANELRLSFQFRGNAITLFESRPSFSNPSQWVEIPAAQFRYDPENTTWTLFCADRNSRWHSYRDANPARKLDALLKKVDEDPTGIFWG